MRLIAIGRSRAGPERDLFDRYTIRLRPGLVVTELPEGRGARSEIKRREAVSLLAAVPATAFVVVLDGGGVCPGSDGFAQVLGRWMMAGRSPSFVIGGAEGLDATVLARADHVLSLGSMTWPHLLVRALLVEQLYRAQCILVGHPYHRAGRP